MTFFNPNLGLRRRATDASVVVIADGANLLELLSRRGLVLPKNCVRSRYGDQEIAGRPEHMNRAPQNDPSRSLVRHYHHRRGQIGGQ